MKSFRKIDKNSVSLRFWGECPTYRNIDVEEDENIQAKVQGLDKEQRAVIDDLVGYAIKYQMYEERKYENPKPAPPFMLVNGNAGTGKAHVIDVLSQLLHTISKEVRIIPIIHMYCVCHILAQLLTSFLVKQ